LRNENDCKKKAKKINKERVKIAIIIILDLFIVFSCTTSVMLPRETVLNSNFTPARHLVFIGLDGWGAAYLNKAHMPTVKRMILDGTSSTETVSVMPSISWPNWTSLFMGTSPEKQENNTPSIFSVVKESFPTVQDDFETQPVLFFEWKYLYNICPDETATKFEISSDYESAYKIASYILTKKPVFTAIVFDEPDSTGHAKGWGSKAYYDKLTLLDNFVAIIEQAVKDSGIYDSTVFVFSSDHGGSFKGHGLNSSKHRKIPLVFYGAGIKKGYVIPFSTDIYDITSSMATILGLQVPQEWIGRPIFEIFDNNKK
jgi:predicted AlkP superfamily pyrophosphatase or phosphodiesterase